MNRRTLAHAVAAFFSMMAVKATAQTTEPLLYEGFLSDADGAPLDGEDELTFRLYCGDGGGDPAVAPKDAATAGPAVVPVTYQDGHFLAVLEGFDAADFVEGPCWLGIARGEQDEFSPRARVGAVPWCLTCGGGEAGQPGLACWDLDGNGQADRPAEDVNGDGRVDVGDCRGADGAPGRDGADGRPGRDGADGADGAAGPPGAPGPASLLRVEPEPPGEHCAAGGTAVHHGVDEDGDGVLREGPGDGEESDGSPAYICDADSGVAVACDPAGPDRDGRLCLDDGRPGVCRAGACCVAAVERCDGVDNDCDGEADEGVPGCTVCAGEDGQDGPPCNRCGADGESVHVPDGWVCIPGGAFMMGSEDGEGRERPVHRVVVQSFLLKRTEVTNAEYRACVTAGACAPPHWYDGTCLVGGGQDRDYGRLPEAFMGSQQPVLCVVWQQARDFARWAGGRLPSEAEWEYAARSGGLNQAYPWGDAPADCQRAVTDDGGGEGCGQGRAWAVCSRSPAGDTVQGVCDMAGNVWEWVEDVYGDYGEAPVDGSARTVGGALGVFRGGSRVFGAGVNRATYRNRGGLVERGNDLGFRPAMSIPSS